MSRMIPQGTVDAFRRAVDVTVGQYGIACTLYVPTNLNTLEPQDIYTKPVDYTYTSYTTNVFIDWKPSKHQLRKFGVFVEDDIPIIAWFPNKINNVDVDITINSYFKVSLQYVPANVGVTEFEIVDVIVPGMHDAVITKYFKIAPRRAQ